MICLRSGYCCTFLDVVIINNPKLGLVDGNAIHKPTGVKCQHLLGDTPGHHACALHDYDWYKETPCYDFTQIESDPSNSCRLGEYYLKQQTGIPKNE
jgi:hypothetical protein